MQYLPSNIYQVADVRRIDRIAIDDNGVPGYTLMQRAAAAAFDNTLEVFPDAESWEVVCGGGNNGGDGYVLARLALQEGVSVSVVSLVDTNRLSGDAAIAHSDFVDADGVVERWRGTLDPDADLLIDALLGSGLDRELSGDFAKAVDAMNHHGAPVHAMDIAAGINGDSGEMMGTAVVAELTTTFVGLKPGLFLEDGAEHCGSVCFADLEIPKDWYAEIAPCYRRVDDELLFEHLHRRGRDSHKGDFGHVLVVGGGPGMPGAALLCGTAALRVGAGKVSVATHPEHAAQLAAARPELMVHGIQGVADLERLLESADVVAFGPGLGQSPWAVEIYERMAADERRCVWDADAVNLLAAKPLASPQRIITPHPGEAARLLGTDTLAIQSDRRSSLASLQSNYGGIAVLKGAGTLVSSSSGVPWLCTAGNPGMAAPGMGDVLTGVIAGLAAQGVPLEMSAAIGAEVHAEAGDIAAAPGERGMMASDLISVLPWVVNP